VDERKRAKKGGGRRSRAPAGKRETTIGNMHAAIEGKVGKRGGERKKMPKDLLSRPFEGGGEGDRPRLSRTIVNRREKEKGKGTFKEKRERVSSSSSSEKRRMTALSSSSSETVQRWKKKEQGLKKGEGEEAVYTHSSAR